MEYNVGELMIQDRGLQDKLSDEHWDALVTTGWNIHFRWVSLKGARCTHLKQVEGEPCI